MCHSATHVWPGPNSSWQPPSPGRLIQIWCSQVRLARQLCIQHGSKLTSGLQIRSTRVQHAHSDNVIDIACLLLRRVCGAFRMAACHCPTLQRLHNSGSFSTMQRRISATQSPWTGSPCALRHGKQLHGACAARTQRNQVAQAIGSPALRPRHRWPQLPRILEGVLHSTNAARLVVSPKHVSTWTHALHPLQAMSGAMGGLRSSLQRAQISNRST